MKNLKFIVFTALLFCTFTFYNCGGGGGDDGSGGTEALNLSKINGRVSDVVAFNFKTEPTTFAKLKKFIEITKSAHAQGGALAGITVIALQMQSGEEVFVDEDITDGDGSFSVDVPAGAIILQFIIGDDVFDILVDIPEDSTVEITVNIDPDDPDNPVVVEEMDVLDGVDDDNDDDNNNVDDQDGDDDDDNDGSQGGNPPPNNNNNNGNQGGNNQGDDDDDDDDDDEAGQGGNNNPPPPPGNNNPPPPPPGNNNPPPTSGNGVTTPDMLALINNVRSQGRNCGNEFFPSAPPLTWNGTIANSTLVHSEDMALVLEDLSHTGSDGSSAGSRLTAQGYNWRAWGENIAFTGGTSGTTTTAVNLWVNSPGHCSNIMNPVYTEMGASRAFGFFTGFQSNGHYWTLVLADSF